MSPRDEALTFDSEDRPLDAIEAYERLLAAEDGETELEDWLNLAVLYFACTDPAYAGVHELEPLMVRRGWTRSRELLNEAEERFGERAEIDFWRGYFRWIVEPDAPFENQCKDMVEAGSSLVPTFYLLSTTGDQRWQEPARELLLSVEGGATTRERYIRSILRSQLAA